MAASDLLAAAEDAARAGDARRARDLYRSVLAADPNAAAAAKALIDLEAGDEASRELALCEQALLPTSEPGPAAVLHLRAAQLWLGRTPPRLDPAIAHLYRALACDPEDDDTFRLLDAALVLAGRPLERAQAWEEAGREGPALRRAERLLRAAELYQSLDRPDQAVACLVRVVAIPGENLRALRLQAGSALAEAERRASKWRELADTLGRLAGDVAGDARARVLAEQAEVLSQQLAARPEAWEAYRQLLALEPDHGPALGFAQRHLEETNQPQELVRVLSAAAAAASVPARAASLWRQVASLAEDRLRDVELARRAWRRAWQLDPEDTEARSALKRLLALAGDWRGYRDLLEREARQVARVDEKIEVYRELAAFQRQVLRDDQAAAEAYGLILQLAPSDSEALAARVEIFEALGQDTLLAEALRRLLRHTEAPRVRAALRERLAETLRRQGLTAQATDELLGAVREAAAPDRGPRADDATQPGVELVDQVRKATERARETAERAGDWVTVARLYEAEGNLAAAAAAFERAGARAAAQTLYRRAGDEAAAARLEQRPHPTAREIEALLAEAAAAGSRAAAGLHYRAAQVYMHQDPPRRDLARAQLVLALERHATDEGAFTLLERLMEADQLWDELVELYRHAITEAREEVRRVELYARLARVHHERRADPAAAIAAWEAVLAIDPANAEGQAQLSALYRQTGRLAGVARLLENELARTPGRARGRLLADLARLLALEMHDPQAALPRYRELLQIEPDHAEALAFCRAHAEGAGAWRDVLALLSRAADATRVAAKRAARYREIAELCEHKLSDREAAAVAWRRACELDPHQADGKAALRRVLGELGRWNDLALTVRAEVARTLPPEDKQPLLEQLVVIERDRLGDPEAALRSLWALIQIAPQHKGAHDQLCELLEKRERHRDLAVMLRRRLELCEDRPERIAVLHRIAALARGALDAPDEALEASREILQLAPGDEGATLTLREIYAAREEWTPLAALLRDTLAHVGKDGTREAALRLELGTLLVERLGQPEEAAREYERGLAVDRTNASLLAALTSLYESLGAWEKLIEIIRRRAAAGHGGLAQALVEIGRICDQRLHDGARAREAYEQATRLDPSRRDALAALRSLAERRSDWREAVALGRREEKLVTDPRERAALLVAIGRVLADKLERAARAAETFEEALRVDAEQVEAAERLADLYCEQNEFAKAAPLLERLVTRGTARDRAHDLYFRLGLAAERAGDSDKAFDYYIQSFNHDSLYEPTLTRLAELCFERGQWDNTVRVCEAIVQAYADRTAAGGADRPQRPTVRLTPAHPGAGGKKPAVIIQSNEELAELYHRLGLAELHIGQRQAALRILPEIAFAGGGRSVLGENAWRDVAEAWAAQRLEPRLLAELEQATRRRAESALGRCLQLKARHAGALQALAALAVARSRWDEALLHLDRCVDVHDLDKGRRCELLLLAGDICAKKTLDRPRAERYFRRAQALFPANPAIRKKLEQLKGAK